VPNVSTPIVFICAAEEQAADLFLCLATSEALHNDFVLKEKNVDAGVHESSINLLLEWSGLDSSYNTFPTTDDKLKDGQLDTIANALAAIDIKTF
jgi:hypothetical protein